MRVLPSQSASNSLSHRILFLTLSPTAHFSDSLGNAIVVSLSRIVLADVNALAELDAEAELASEASAAEESFVAPVGPEGVEGAGVDAPRTAPYLTLFELSRASRC
jgi:hypothetical protein